MFVYGLDPGPEKSALVIWHPHAPTQPVAYSFEDNGVIRRRFALAGTFGAELVIEVPVPFLMPMQDRNGRRVMGSMAGSAVYDTTVWAGRFAEAWIQGDGKAPVWLTRPQVLIALLGKKQGMGDPEVRGACLERWGGEKKALGTSLNPGPLRGVTSHGWQALGLAIAAHATGWEKVRRFEV